MVRSFGPMEPPQEYDIAIDLEPPAGLLRRTWFEGILVQAGGQDVDSVGREPCGHEPPPVRLRGGDDRVRSAEGLASEEGIVQCALDSGNLRPGRLGHSMVERVHDRGRSRDLPGYRVIRQEAVAVEVHDIGLLNPGPE